MSKKVLLISELEVKTGSNIEQGVDGKILSKTINDVQEIYLKPILGVNLYDSVIDSVFEFKMNGTAIPTLYSDLLVIIKSYLINKVVTEFLIPNSYKITDKGLMKMNDNSASNISDSDLNSVKNYYNNLSTTFKKNLIEFLSKNNLADSTVETEISSDATGWFLGEGSNVIETISKGGSNGGPIGPQGSTGSIGATGPAGTSANESNIVHLTGAETITGNKTINVGSTNDALTINKSGTTGSSLAVNNTATATSNVIKATKSGNSKGNAVWGLITGGNSGDAIRGEITSGSGYAGQFFGGLGLRVSYSTMPGDTLNNYFVIGDDLNSDDYSLKMGSYWNGSQPSKRITNYWNGLAVQKIDFVDNDSIRLGFADSDFVNIKASGNMLIGSTTDNTIDRLQVTGSILGTSFKKSGGLSTQYLMADGSIDSVVKQPLLVSGTSIKTINGVSILGAGDMVIGGSSQWNTSGVNINYGTGNVSIGATANDGNTLQVYGNSSFYGNVGIGTLLPNAKLHVAENGSGIGVMEIQNTDATGYSSIAFDDITGSQIGSIGYGNSGTGDGVQGKMFLKTSYNDFVISLNDGFSAKHIFSADGNTLFGGSVTATSIKKSGGTSLQYLMADGSTSLGGGSSQWNTSGTSINYLTGNVLIGTTTDDGTNKLQVSGSSLLGGVVNHSGNLTPLTDNTLSIGIPSKRYSNGWFYNAYIGSLISNSINDDGINGIKFKISSTERMRVASTGNILIGSTTDDLTNKLQVAGSLSASGNIVSSNSITAGNTVTAEYVVIGDSTGPSCAKLTVTSTTKGVLLPRMTKVQRNAIASPVAGLAIYQTDNTAGLRVYNGTNWVKYSETID